MRRYAVKILRGFIAFCLILLVLLIEDWQANRTSNAVMQPQYEQAPLEGRDFVYYTVQPGDSIYSIQKKFRVASEDSILKMNPELDPDRLPTTAEIKIPLQ